MDLPEVSRLALFVETEQETKVCHFKCYSTLANCANYAYSAWQDLQQTHRHTDTHTHTCIAPPSWVFLCETLSTLPLPAGLPKLRPSIGSVTVGLMPQLPFSRPLVINISLSNALHVSDSMLSAGFPTVHNVAWDKIPVSQLPPLGLHPLHHQQNPVLLWPLCPLLAGTDTPASELPIPG